MNHENARRLAAALRNSGIENEHLHVGIMATVAKECCFEIVRERGYGNTSDERIRKIFSRCRKLSDAELHNLKSDDRKFFNYVYNGKLGNRKGTNDGYDFRGGGWPQVTGRGNFKRLCPDWAALTACAEIPSAVVYMCIKFYTIGLLKKAVLITRYGRPKTDEIGMLWAVNIAAGVGNGKRSAVVKRATKNAFKYVDECRGIYDRTNKNLHTREIVSQ